MPFVAPPKIRIGGIPIHVITFAETLDAVDALVAGGAGGSVFTPNVDHVVLYDEDPAVRSAYEQTTLSVVDGMPVLWASKLLGTPLPQKVSGSDLLLPLSQRAAERGWRVMLVGGGEGVAEIAKREIERIAPGVKIVATLSPRVDLSEPPSVRAPIIEAVRAQKPDLVFFALGSPKQELFIAEVREALKPAVLIGIGAGLDFVAGVVPRAPRWVANVGLEWAYRLAREPRRLWRRYLVRDPKFLLILARSLRRPHATSA